MPEPTQTQPVQEQAQPVQQPPRPQPRPIDLEQLLVGAVQAKNLARASSVRIDNDLINAAKRVYSGLFASGVTDVNPETFGSLSQYDLNEKLQKGYGQVIPKLQERLDDGTYGKLKKQLKNLDENHKLIYYSLAVQDGLIPRQLPREATNKDRESYQVLAYAKQELDLAKQIEIAVSSGNLGKAGELISKLGVDTRALASIGSPGGSSSPDRQSKIYMDVAIARKNMAYHVINEAKLYGVIDKGISENPQGKALSVIAMYEAAQQQAEYNARAQQGRH